jgi:amino acid transporter
MGIITYFIPYLFLFASMFRLQREAAGPEVIRVPGGRPVAILVSCVGFATTLFTIGLSLVPPAEEPNKLLATAKIVGLSAILVGVGATMYYAAKRKRQKRQSA